MIAVLGVLAAALAAAEEPRLEWGPADGSWTVATAMNNGQRVGQSGSGAMNQQLKRTFWGDGYSVGQDGDGPLVQFDVQERPIKTLAECEAIVSPNSRRFYQSVTCRATTFQGLPAVQMVGVLVQDRHEQIVIEVAASTDPPRTLAFVIEIRAKSSQSMARNKQRVQQLLATFRIIGEAPPARIWSAEIRFPSNLKPGDVLSPTVVVTDQDGKPPSEPVQVRLLINRQWAESVTWDGSRTEIEAQVSIEHHAVVAKAVVPRYQAPPPGRPAPPPPAQALPPGPVQPTRPSGPAVRSPVVGLGGAGGVPGPRTTLEGLASILGPAGLGLLGSLLSGLLGGGQAPPTAPEAPAEPPPAAPPGKQARRRKREAGEPPAAPKPKPDKERAKERIRDAEKAAQEGAEATSVVGLLGLWKKNVQKDFKEAGEQIDSTFDKAKQGLGFVADKAKQAFRTAVDDPKGAFDKVVKETEGFVREAGRKVFDEGKKLLDAGFREAKSLAEDPRAAIDNVRERAARLRDTVTEFITDPNKIWQAVKDATGIQNFENCVDPNRSLLDRFKEVGVGVYKLYTTITTAQAAGAELKAAGARLKEGLTTVFNRLRGAPSRQAVTDAMKKAEKYAKRARLQVWKEQFENERRLGGTSAGVREMPGPVDLSSFTKEEQKAIQVVVDRHCLRAHVRPRGPIARELIETGQALPKPEMIKAKTVSELDTLLGYPREARGVVACKQPMMPGKRPPGMDDKAFAKLQDRCAQRAREFRDQAAKLHKLEKKGKIVWDRKSGVVYDKATGKPFTGDHDMLVYTDPRGNEVSHFVREQANRDLLAMPHPHCPDRGILEHREHMGWDLNKVPDTAARGSSRSQREVARDIKERIIDSHAPSKEPLTCFNPNSPPSHTWYVED